MVCTECGSGRENNGTTEAVVEETVLFLLVSNGSHFLKSILK